MWTKSTCWRLTSSPAASLVSFFYEARWLRTFCLVLLSRPRVQLFLLPVLFALDLNLLDLPGVVGGCVEGEPADMADRTRRLVSKYLARPDGEI